ncbi:MAG TPA: hypothetical protein EYP74_02655 [Anaerolineales bacterium]|nr:hypothetical protein [Anaerolineales bacterium]
MPSAIALYHGNYTPKTIVITSIYIQGNQSKSAINSASSGVAGLFFVRQKSKLKRTKKNRVDPPIPSIPRSIKDPTPMQRKADRAKREKEK